MLTHFRTMAIKAALTLTSALMVICSLLMGFFTYSSSGWISNVDAAINDLKPRVLRLETENQLKWIEASRRLESVEHKQDLLLQRR